MKGSHILINTLIEQGVDVIFGYPGGAVLDIYDALYDYQDKIKHILTSHEQGAAHAADGYARSTGKTGVVLATSGPGATNLVTGIATAYMDSIPLVCITGNVATNLIGKDSFQEIYITGITLPITKHNMVVRDIEELSCRVKEAFRIANSKRKGPVLIDLPKDILNMDFEHKKTSKFYIQKETFNDNETLHKIADMINNSKKPIFYCGGGVVSSNATEELENLVKKANIPTCNTLMGIGILDGKNSLNLGMVGMHGRISTNLAIENCDLLLAIGVRFSDRVALNTRHFAPNAKIIHIDIDASEIGKNVPVDFSVIADAKEILSQLLPLINANEKKEWLDKIEEFKRQDYVPSNSCDKLSPYQIIKYIDNNIKNDDIVVTDVGQHQMWAAQYFTNRKIKTFITSGGLGTMGFGLGAAIGAKVANQDKNVIHITGDGSFHMNLNEFPTSITNNIKIISVVFNNGVLGMPRQWQHYLYKDRFSVSTYEKSTDYVKLAEAFGGIGYKCTTFEEFKDAFNKALKSEKSSIIECKIDKNEQVLPMIPAGGTINDLIVSN